MQLFNYLVGVCLLCVFTIATFLPPLTNDVLIDYDPNETFLSVFLTIYHMTWSHAVHFNRIHNVLSEFENNPVPLYQDDISLQIVCEQVLFGFINDQNGGFLYTRSRRLLLRILRNYPTQGILNELLDQAALAGIEDISQIMGRFAFEAFIESTSLISLDVLDSAPLLTGSLPASLSEKFYTVPAVIEEIRDEASRTRLSQLPFKLETRSPSAEAMAIVTRFARATGDLSVLSATDLQVIALTVTLNLEELPVEKSKMRRDPSELPKETTHDGAVFKNKKSLVDDNDNVNVNVNDNVNDSSLPSSCRIACITSDFAMQNVLLQMRLELYTPDGCRVKNVKNWLLRCHACCTTTRNMEARFCPKCGGPTLIRTSYMIDETGACHLFLRSDFQYNLRGTKFNLPKFRGGRQGDSLILREDQKEFRRQKEHYERVQAKIQKNENEEEKSSLEAIDDRIAAVFGGGSVSQVNRRYDAYDGLSLPVIGHGRRNPNASKKSK